MQAITLYPRLVNSFNTTFNKQETELFNKGRNHNKLQTSSYQYPDSNRRATNKQTKPHQMFRC